MAYSAFFQPADGWVGDVIPIEVDGEFWLFYLLERREDPKPGTPWALVTTKDFLRFDDRGVAFPHGGPDEADFNVYTGCVVRDDRGDRKSTRLNSSHGSISYAVFCLKKKKKHIQMNSHKNRKIQRQIKILII